MRKSLQRAYLVSSEPFRDYLQQRFDALEQSGATVHANQDAQRDRLDALRAETADLNHRIEETQDYIRALAAQLGAEIQHLADRLVVPEQLLRTAEQEAEALGVEGLSAPFADLINFSRSHRGFSAQAGVWVNEPVVIAHEPQGVRVAGVNSRIVEVPFCMQALAALPRGARVVDVGASESTLALSLASGGFRVTAVDPRGYPFDHPLLDSHVGTLDDLAAHEALDAVVFLSSVEHFGLPAYSLDGLVDADADSRAVARARDLLAPGGLLVLTVPFGDAGVSEFERTYDDGSLRALLAGFTDVQIDVAVRRDHLTWQMHGDSSDDGLGGEAVALVTATAPG